MAESTLTPFDQHRQRILDSLEPLPAYDQPLLDAIGLPIAEDVVSQLSLPSFDNASMDGYAVYFRDVAEADEHRPVHLPVVGDLAAGGRSPVPLGPGTTIRIMTGAPLPPGADAVVPVEWTDGGTAQVAISQAPEQFQYIRWAGEDLKPGDRLMAEGDLIRSRHIGLLASVGRDHVAARPRPRVAVLSTGDELTDPGRPLRPGAIYDGNSYQLAAAVRAAGAIPYRVGIVSDDPAGFQAALEDQMGSVDAIITSGGVSKGAFDVVKEVLSRTGTVTFEEVGMQPGKPQGFGFVGEDRIPIFALPGNPVSSYVSFEVLVLPALRKMMGRTVLSRPLMRAELTTPLSSVQGKRQFLRGRYAVGPDGPQVTPIGTQGSHLIGDLAQANALIVLGEDQASAAPGQDVPVLVLDRDF